MKFLKEFAVMALWATLILSLIACWLVISVVAFSLFFFCWIF